MIRLALPWPVSMNDYWRSFVPPGSRVAQIHLSTEAKQYKRDVQWLARQAGVRSPMLGRLQVCMWLTPHSPLDAAKRAGKSPNDWDMSVHCHDVDNVAKVTLDALKGIAFEDDAQVHRLLIERTEPGRRGLLVVVEPWVPSWLRQPALFEASA